MSKPHADRCPTCRRRMTRSTHANARYWLLVHRISERITPAGVSHSPEVWHHYFKSKYIGCDDFALPNGEVLVMPRSSSDLDVAEFNDFMGRVEVWASGRGVWLDEIPGAA